MGTNETDDKTNKLTDRLALPSEENEYDGDVSEMSHSQVRRGRRSIKRKQPPKGGVALFGKADLFEGKNPFAHRRGDSEEKEAEHSERCDPSDKNSLTKKEASEKERLDRAKEEEDQRKREEEMKNRLEQERKQEVERKIKEEQERTKLKEEEERKRKIEAEMKRKKEEEEEMKNRLEQERKQEVERKIK